MRHHSRRTSRLLVRTDDALMRLYTLEELTEANRWDLIGYWTGREVFFGQSLWRAAAWLVFGRLPRRYYWVVADVFVPQKPSSSLQRPPGFPPQPPRGGQGDPGGTREPRRPIHPHLSGAAELPLPNGD